MDAPPSLHPTDESLPSGLAEHPDYEVLRELGRGGMGVVYLAHNRLMGRDEVLKLVGQRVLERPGALERFLREIRAVAKLRHPNIVTAYTAFRIGESIAFAMEYVDGLDLARMVKAKGPLPVAHACSFAHQAALGLQHAHEQGLVHRDIKPGNLMLSRRSGRAIVQILDFGLAKIAREDPVDGGLTHEGQMLGTPDFIAPEQTIDAQKADIRADIYSLGCTLYYMLTGGPPFRGTSLYDILQAHHSMDARPVNLVRPEVQVELAAVIARMMAKDPDRRYQTPGDVAQAVAPFFKKTSTASRDAKAEFSQVQPMSNETETTGLASAPTRRETNPIPVPGRETRLETAWETLLEVRETGPLSGAPEVVAPARRPPWVWPSVAAGVLILGLVAALAAGVFKVKTKDGVILLIPVPESPPAKADQVASSKPAEPPSPTDPPTVTGSHDTVASSKPAEHPSSPRPARPPAEPAAPPDSAPKSPQVSQSFPRNQWITLDPAKAIINGLGKAENGLLSIHHRPGRGTGVWWANPSIRARNMIIRAHMKKPDWDAGTIGMGLRWDARTGESYSATLAKFSNRKGYQFTIEKHFRHGAEPGWAVLKRSAVRPVPALDIDNFFEFAFSAVGDTLSVTVDGKRVVQARDPEFKEGTITLGAWQTRAFYKDLEVKILDD